MSKISPGSARRWISRHKAKPTSGLCEHCNKRQYRYLVNVTGNYTREVDRRESLVMELKEHQEANILFFACQFRIKGYVYYKPMAQTL